MSGPSFQVESQQPAPGAAASGLRPPLPPTPQARGLLDILTSPRLFYGLGFLCMSAMLWFRFNPQFGNFDYGVLGQRSPINVFRDAAGEWNLTWGLAQRAVIYMLLLMVGYLALTCWRAGKRRGAIALGLLLLVFVTRPPAPDQLNIVLLYVAAGGLAGALFVPHHRATIWTRRVLWMSLALLLTVLWMPLTIKPNAPPSYNSAGLELVREWTSPPAFTPYGEPIEGFLLRAKYLFLGTLPLTMAMLLSLLGVLRLVGLKGGWLRGLSLLIFAIMFVGSSVAIAWNESIETPHLMLGHWQNGFYALGELWFNQFTVHGLPLAAAVQDMTARRTN